MLVTSHNFRLLFKQKKKLRILNDQIKLRLALEKSMIAILVYVKQI